ncbi:CHM family protein [Megaselia abdita]
MPGFTESIVAAAASRIGKTVLHIDSNEYYGGQWASFNLEGFQKHLSESPNFQATQNWNTDESETSEWTKENILKTSRRFSIDLTPKLLFSRGKLVKLLISSNICRYAEFRAADNVCTFEESTSSLKSVPCSRTDVFNSKDLTIIEKRLLMKLLNSFLNYKDEEVPEEFKNYLGKPFLEFLKFQRLTPKIINNVMNSISMCDEDALLEEGIEKTKNFLLNLGFYGNTPFLFPMYGCGEIPQCFCRLCAVFGGVYCLKKPISKIEEKDDEISFTTDNQVIKAKKLVFGSSNIPEELLSSEKKTDHCCGGLSRGVFILEKPLGSEELNSGGGGVNFLKLPGGNGGAFILQLSHYSGTCPKGLHLVHITSKSSSTPSDDLQPFVEKLFTDEHKPLYTAYFTLPSCSSKVSTTENIVECCGTFFELDYDKSIENAEMVFKKLYPDEEFLPRAPDPEEIIIENEDPTAISEHTLPEDLKAQLLLEESSKEV